MQNKKMLPLTDRRALVVYLQDMRYRRIAFQNFRWAYNLDGIDDRWTLASRAINPDGDIDVEFRTGPSVGAAATRVILSQNIIGGAGAEFILQALSTGLIQVVAGGSFSSTAAAPTLQPNTSYRITLIGATLSFWLNGALFSSFSFTRGGVREPTSQTAVGARTSGAVGSFTSYYQGILYNVKINGTLWPIADRNQSVQPSIPAGNNMTGANLNPDRWVEIPK